MPFNLIVCVAFRTTEPQLQEHWSGAIGAEVPGHRQEQLTQTLTVCLLITYLFSLIFNLGGGPGPPFALLDANYIQYDQVSSLYFSRIFSYRFLYILILSHYQFVLGFSAEMIYVMLLCYF